jgi:hypothetical protein
LSEENLGPLFQHPVEHYYLWVVSILLAIPAVTIAIWGLIRGQLSAASAVSALIVVPVFAYFLGNLVIMQESKKIAFCGSCHETMGPLVDSSFRDNGSLASQHFRGGSASREDGCFVCHSGYGIWGNAEAKVAGVAHMIHTVTRRYELPLQIRGTFDISSCLDCHAETPGFRGEAAHREPANQDALLSGEMSCTGVCHPAAHPRSALLGAEG